MDFVAGVSHELRTPVAAILSISDNIASGAISDKGKITQYGELIRKQARQLNQLVEQVLNFSAATKRNESTTRTVSVSDAIDQALESTAPLITDASVDVRCNIEPNTPPAYGDQVRLSQCLQNLITNAIKYGGNGKRIRHQMCALFRTVARLARWKLLSRTRALESARKIYHVFFEPFYRSPEVMESAIHGTGLGLSVTKGYVESMGGEIRVTSKPNAGSTFTIGLKAAGEPLKDVEPRVIEKAFKPKILIVEDEEALRIALSDRLMLEHYEVEYAADGETGYQTALQEKFDLILLDVMLPRKRGLDVCRDLRQAGLVVPIIMLTARAETIDKVLGLKIGADDYVTKPFEMVELLARIEAQLRRPTAPPSPANEQIVEFGGVRVDLPGTSVTKNDKVVPLSAQEFQLLRYFIQHPGTTLSREVLLEGSVGLQFGGVHTYGGCACGEHSTEAGKVIRKNQHCSLRSLGSATNLFPHSARYSQSYDGDRPFSILTINSLNWTCAPFVLHGGITSQPAERPVPAKSLMACRKLAALDHFLTLSFSTKA